MNFKNLYAWLEMMGRSLKKTYREVRGKAGLAAEYQRRVREYNADTFDRGQQAGSIEEATSTSSKVNQAMMQARVAELIAAKSELKNILGVKNEHVEALLDRFSAMAAVRAATYEELLEVVKDEEVAERMFNFYHPLAARRRKRR